MSSPSEVFRRKKNDARAKTSAEWADVPAAHRTNAFFSATVEKAALLQRMRDMIDDYLSGAREEVILPDGTSSYVKKVGGKEDFIAKVREFMEQEGMTADARNNKITNIGARSRLSLIFDTQVRAAYGQARWEEGMTDDMLKAYPAWRFVRRSGAKVKRIEHALNEDAVKLKTDYNFWAKEMNSRDLGGFEVPWPPFGFNSWMDLESVSAAEYEKITGKAAPDDQIGSINNFGATVPERAIRTTASTKCIKDPELVKRLKAALKKRVGSEGVDENGRLTLSPREMVNKIEERNDKIRRANIEEKMRQHGEFRRAETREEAIETTKCLGNNVSFHESITLEQINDFNEAAWDFNTRFSPPKLVRYGSSRVLDKKGRDKDRTNAVSSPYKIELNHDREDQGIHSSHEQIDYLSPLKDEVIKLNDEITYLRKEGLNNLADMREAKRSELVEKISRMEKGDVFWRYGVGDSKDGLSVKDAVYHEGGHVLHLTAVLQEGIQYGKTDTSQVTMMIRETLQKARSNGDIFRISKYADKGPYDFFAECFAMYMRGEALPDYIMDMVYEIVQPYRRHDNGRQTTTHR